MRKGMQLFPISWCWGKPVSKQKAIELQLEIGKNRSEWFRFCLQTRSKQDHAGLYFEIELLTVFYFHFWFYDTRHWNYGKGRFYDEPAEFRDEFF